MTVLHARNVHRALSHGLYLMDTFGHLRDSRNGPVKMTPWPVMTEYEFPTERVVFWPERDANPFFHLYEALWMLCGRHDIQPLGRYAKQMLEYSDDGVTQHGAYGWRWLKHFALHHARPARSDGGILLPLSFNQLEPIADALRVNAEDRRQVLQMWDAQHDLSRKGKDLPCNLMATFQRDKEGRLDLTVFCRSNDIIWGAYGANAVHFSMLLEYMALKIGCPVGVYRQISVNWHGYVNGPNGLDRVKSIPRQSYEDPYSQSMVHSVPMTLFNGDVWQLDKFHEELLRDADNDVLFTRLQTGNQYVDTLNAMLLAHERYRKLDAPAKYLEPISVLKGVDTTADWIQAGIQWMDRRYSAWKAKQA